MNRLGRYLAAICLHLPAALAMADCLGNIPVDGVADLRAGNFEVADGARRNELALALAECTGDPDPRVRDGIAFETLSRWLRGKALAPATVDGLRERLVAQLRAPPDADGFRHPFAALLLSEVARFDRIDPVFSDEDRAVLVSVAADHMRQMRDYRGFVDGEGWRHGVAHGADLVLQLAVSPQVDAKQVAVLLDAVSSQVVPEGMTHYVHGEPERLARVVIYTCQRDLLAPRFWNAWFAHLIDPAPMPDWSAAYASERGLARRHNLVDFLLKLDFGVRSLDGPDVCGLRMRAQAALQRVMAD